MCRPVCKECDNVCLCSMCEGWQLNSQTSFHQCFLKPPKPSCYCRKYIARSDTAPTAKRGILHMILTEHNDNSHRISTELCELQTAPPYKTHINLFFNVLTKLFNLNIIIFGLIPIGSYTRLHKKFPGLENIPLKSLWRCSKLLCRFHIHVIG